MSKQPKVVYESKVLRWLPWNFWVYGKHVAGTLLFRQRKDQVVNYLFRHELEHFYQMQRNGGVIPHYAKYLALLIRYGYKKHPYEIAAREAGKLPLTEEEKTWKADPGGKDTVLLVLNAAAMALGIWLIWQAV